MIGRLIRLLGILAVLAAVVGLGAYFGRIQLLRLRLELPSFTHSRGEEELVRVVMSDGVELATSVYRPAGEGAWPVVLIRNPYDAGFFLRSWCELFVRYGYACVFQEVRGQMQSGGEWDPLVNEIADGQDTLQWLVEQPFQDGNIALYGPSYLGAVQWAMAARGLPPEVKTMVPLMTGTDFYRVAYQRGMFRHEVLTAWSALMPGRGFRNGNGEHYKDAARHRPHIEADEEFFGERLDWYRDWVTSPSPHAPFWKRAELVEVMAAPSRLEIPVLSFAGWYDIFFDPQLRDWQRLASRGRSKLVIGPWTHIMEAGGELELDDARGGAFQWKLVLDWLGHHLRGEELEQSPSGVERYVIRGDGSAQAPGGWSHLAEWPPRTSERRWYLASLGSAHGCGGGRLGDGAPTSARHVSYVYDPEDPVPMRGGAGTLAFILPGFDGGPEGSVDQGVLCERADVLSFASGELDAPLHLAGRVRVALRVSSDAADTSFTAKLVEVRADGRAFNVRDGIATLALRDESGTAQRYEPGDEVRIEIETWPIDWIFAPGSRLRLDVSSSNFPAYHAHPNRAGVWAEVPDSVPATQTLHGGELVLPLVAPH